MGGRGFIVAVVVVAALGCDPETTSYAAERFQGGCRDPLPAGAAPGDECVEAADCAAHCCACSEGVQFPFDAQVCLNGRCADVADACATIEVEQPQLCLAALIVEQDDGTCPASLKEGVAAGEACVGADACAATCCACPTDAARTYAVAACDDGACVETADACADALAGDPALCP